MLLTEKAGRSMCARKRTFLKTALSKWSALGRDERGVELVEFAFVLPLFCILVFGILWLGGAYSTYETITRAAREGAEVAVARTCATCGNTANSDANVLTAVNNALQAAALAPGALGACPGLATPPAPPVVPPCGCPASQVCIQRDVPLNSNPGVPLEPQEFGVVVSITYPYSMNVPFGLWAGTNGTAINISTQVEMREEN